MADCQPTSLRKPRVFGTLKPCLLTDLKEALVRYDSYKGELLEGYKSVCQMFGKVYEILGEADPVTIRIKAEMEEKMMPIKHLKRDPIILVSGQVNSGKSSLINEILENSLVPVEELPCTSRIVRIKYSEVNYYQIYDKDGHPKGEKHSYGKKVEKEGLKKQIKLRSSGNFEEVLPSHDEEETVEIGIKSELLKSGIQIVDTPGMSENDTLDRIVQECLDGVLQVLIYVIDANPSQREVDQKFLTYIRSKAPEMKILYACNKCEENAVAREKDNPTPPSSDDEDEDACDGNTSEPARQAKGEAVFDKLKSRGQIEEVQDIKTCDHFFQLSCLAIRHARHNKAVSQEQQVYVNEFHRLITHTICHFQDCVNLHLVNTISNMYALATKAFDFFVSDKFLNQRAWNNFTAKMTKTKEIEESAIATIRSFIKDEKQHLYDSIQMVIDERKEHIIEKGANLEFTSHTKTWNKKTTKLYRDNLSAFLLQTLSEEITSKGVVCGLLETIEKKVKTHLRALFKECGNLGGIGDLLPQLESCYNIVVSAPVSKSFSKQLMRKELRTRLYFLFEQFTFEHIHAPVIDKEWQRTTMKRLLGSVAVEELGNIICDQFSSQISKAHQKFLDVLELIEVIHKRRRIEQRNLLASIPMFSSMICKLRSLKGEIDFGKGRVVICDLLVGGTSRSLIYDCQYEGRKATARRVKNYDENLHNKFAELINYTRLLQLNHKNVMRVLDVYCDRVGLIHAIVPYLETNLFHMLCNSIKVTRPSLRDRLVIAHNIVKACEFVADRGFRVTDLRPNNILMSNGIPMLNLLKWKSLEAPYPAPDGKPPFHWAPEVILSLESKSIKTYDTYSCTILIWWLAMGEFVRPRFVDTNNMNLINAIVTNRLREVSHELTEALNNSDARTHATEHEKKLLDRVQAILTRNITEADERMDIAKLQAEMKEIIRS